MQVEMYTGDIPEAFDRFSTLIGPQHWKNRVSLIKSAIKGNRLLNDHLIQENEIAFGLQASSEFVKRYGRIPIDQFDLRPLYACMAFATQVLSIADTANRTQRIQLVRRVHGALKNPDDMRALRLELTAATHFLRRGLKIRWPELTGEGTMDLIVEGLGEQGLEVECKSVSEDKGRKIHRHEALDFCALMAPELNALGNSLTSGVAAVLTLDGRMPSAFSERKRLAQSVVKNVLSGKSFCQLGGATLRVSDFNLEELGNVGADGLPTITRENVDVISQTQNRQAMIVGRKSGGAIMFVIQSSQDDSLLTQTFGTISKSANKQLSRERAGMFLVGLEGIEAESLMELAKQDSTLGSPPTALRLHVSKFLASQERDHVIGLGFISKGAYWPSFEGQLDSGGTAYVFPKSESPYWHSDFAGLFTSRSQFT